MSDFSDLLKEYLSEKNKNVISMAKYCRTDKSTMYKILNASRLPASEELVRRIAGFLQLTPDEEDRLTESYMLAREGKTTYYRRKEAERFLTEPFVNTGQNISFNMIREDNADQEIRMYRYPHSVDSNLYEAILREAENENGSLSLYLTDADDRFSMFTADVLKKYPGLSMDCITMVNDDSYEYSNENSGRINLRKLQCILPLISLAENRRFYYSYGNISQDTHLPYFTNMVITSDTVILFSNGHTRSMCIHDPQVCSEYSEIFAEARDASRKLVTRSAISGPDNPGGTVSDMHIKTIFDMYPHFDLSDSFTEESLPDTAGQKRKSTMQNRRTTAIHCFDGYRAFMETGLLRDTPSGISEPLSMNERTSVLQSYIHDAERMHLYVLKKSIGPVTGGFSIILHDNAMILCFSDQEGRSITVRLDEFSFFETFDDYLDSLIRKEDLFYTKAELTVKLAELLEQYRQ